MLAELAKALRALGKHAEAQRCCTAAVTARPDYQRGWLELGHAQAAQGELPHDYTVFACHGGRTMLHVTLNATAGSTFRTESCCNAHWVLLSQLLDQ